MLIEFLRRCLLAIKRAFRTGFIPLKVKKLRPGIDTSEDVLELLGPASMAWHGPAGVTWEYACTPAATENFMVDFDTEGTVLRVRQVLTAANFARIVRGMDKDDVRRLLGKPAHELHFSLKNEDVWDWRIPADAGSPTYFNVHFDAGGTVCATSRTTEARP